ncbi:hypothetical protein AB0J65_26270, partial [Streptomyces toxytricini]
MGRRADETRPGRARNGEGADGSGPGLPDDDLTGRLSGGTGTGSRRGRTALWSQHDGLVAVGAAAVDLVGFTVTSQMDRGHVPLSGCLITVAAALFLLARRRAPLCVLACVLAANVALTWSSSVGQHYGAVTVVALYTAIRHRSIGVTGVIAGGMETAFIM